LGVRARFNFTAQVDAGVIDADTVAKFHYVKRHAISRKIGVRQKPSLFCLSPGIRAVHQAPECGVEASIGQSTAIGTLNSKAKSFYSLDKFACSSAPNMLPWSLLELPEMISRMQHSVRDDPRKFGCHGATT
jgi:hypothetical protein